MFLDDGWKSTIEECFTDIQSKKNPDLPFGTACVAFNEFLSEDSPRFLLSTVSI